MPRTTKAELEQENAELREKLAGMYDEIGDLLGVDDDEDEDQGEDDED